MDEQKAVEYLDSLKKRAFMTMNEVDLANLVLKYKNELSKEKEKNRKAIEHLHKRNEQNNSALTNKEETIISKHELLKLENINNKILEDILRGKDETK